MNRKDKGTTQQGSPGAKHFSICGKSGFSYCIWVEKNKKASKKWTVNFPKSKCRKGTQK